MMFHLQGALLSRYLYLRKKFGLTLAAPLPLSRFLHSRQYCPDDFYVMFLLSFL